MKRMRTIVGAFLVILASISSAQSTEQSAKAARIRAAWSQTYIDEWDISTLESFARKSLTRALSTNASFEDVAFAYEVCAQYMWNDAKRKREFWDKQIFAVEKKFRTFKLGGDQETRRIKLIVDMDGWSGWGSAAIYAECKVLAKAFPNDPGVARALAITEAVYGGKEPGPELRSLNYFSNEMKKYPRCIPNYVHYAMSASSLGHKIPSEKKKYFTIARDTYRKLLTLVPKDSSAYSRYERQATGFQKAIDGLP